MKGLLKQYDIKQLKWAGSFIGVLYLVAPLIGMAGYVMTAITMYTVLIPYMKASFAWMTLPLFFLFLIVIVIVVLLLFFKFVYPSYYAFLNRQMYIHKNPIQKDLQLIKEKLGIKENKDGN